MSGASKHKAGTIVWTDLTVPNAEEIRDFYKSVVGWESGAVDMGDYSDFCMTPPGDDKPAVGICHARGPNANLPPQWLVYIFVDSVSASVERCVELGGKIIDGPRKMGNDVFCVIQDPAGAVAGLYGPSE